MQQKKRMRLVNVYYMYAIIFLCGTMNFGWVGLVWFGLVWFGFVLFFI
jgi:hypothetical protein